MAYTTLTDSYKQIGKTNSIYERNQSRWQFLLESYTGGDMYRNAAHLNRYVLESDSEYAARLRSTPLDNHCRSVISVYVSFLFRTPATRVLSSIDSLELQDFLLDADLDGRSLDSFIKEVSIWSSVFGHSWILMTKPSMTADSAGQQLSAGVRPYVNLLTPLTVLDWTWTRLPNGRYDLTYFKYIEDVNGDVTIIREWTQDSIKTWESNDRTKEAVLILEEVNELNRIPAVIAYNQRSQIRGIGMSDIDDIADMQRSIYNELSEVEQCIRLEGHPSLVATPDTQIGSGSGALIHIPENLDPGLVPYMLNADATPINMIYESIKNRVSAIDKMANTGAVRATESKTMSGIALETEFQLLNARLSEKADNLELAEEQLWNLWCEYQALSNREFLIEYPGSFNVRDTGRELDELTNARDATSNARIQAVVDYKIMNLLETDPDVIAAAVAEFTPGVVSESESALE